MAKKHLKKALKISTVKLRPKRLLNLSTKKLMKTAVAELDGYPQDLEDLAAASDASNDVKDDVGKNKIEDDAIDASDDVKDLDKDVEDEDDIETLGNKAENRAVQLASRRAAKSVKNELEQTGTVNTTLGDGSFKKIVAPEKKEASKETSPTKIKARILGEKAEEGRGQEMPGYTAEQPAASLSDKAEVPQNQEEDLSNKAREALEKNDDIKALSAKTEEDNDVEALGNEAEEIQDDAIKALDVKTEASETVKDDEFDCEECLTETPMKRGLKSHMLFHCEECLTETLQMRSFKKHIRPEHDDKLRRPGYDVKVSANNCPEHDIKLPSFAALAKPEGHPLLLLDSKLMPRDAKLDAKRPIVYGPLR